MSSGDVTITARAAIWSAAGTSTPVADTSGHYADGAKRYGPRTADGLTGIIWIRHRIQNGVRVGYRIEDRRATSRVVAFRVTESGGLPVEVQILDQPRTTEHTLTVNMRGIFLSPLAGGNLLAWVFDSTHASGSWDTSADTNMPAPLGVDDYRVAFMFADSVSPAQAVTSSYTIGIPSPARFGDSLFAYIVRDTIGAPTPPAGWEFVAQHETAALAAYVYCRRQPLSWLAPTVWTFGASATTFGVIFAVRNQIRADGPIVEAVSSVPYTANDNILRAGSLDLPTNNPVLVLYHFHHATLAGIGPATHLHNHEWTQRLANPLQFGVRAGIHEPGPTGNIDQTSAVTTLKHAFAIALRSPHHTSRVSAPRFSAGGHATPRPEVSIEARGARAEPAVGGDVRSQIAVSAGGVAEVEVYGDTTPRGHVTATAIRMEAPIQTQTTVHVVMVATCVPVSLVGYGTPRGHVTESISGAGGLYRDTVTVYNVLPEVDRTATWRRTVLMGVATEIKSAAAASLRGSRSADGLAVVIPGDTCGYVAPDEFDGTHGWTLRPGDIIAVGEVASATPPKVDTYRVTGIEARAMRGRLHHIEVAGE